MFGVEWIWQTGLKRQLCVVTVIRVVVINFSIYYSTNYGVLRSAN